MVRTGPFKLALIITLIMGIALGFLYLLERQKIYSSIKENSRNLANQEQVFHQHLGQEWDKSLKRLMSHNNMRLYLKAYSKRPNNVAKVYTDTLANIFSDVTTYKSNLIHRISLISLEGQELVATEQDKLVDSLKNWYSNDYFRETLSQPVNKLISNQFHVEGTEAYLYKSVPLAVGEKKVAILTFTILIKDIIDKYRYLLAATHNDQIIAVTKTGKLLAAFDTQTIDQSELNKVFTALKQKASNDPILEFRQNVWSFINNEEQDFYILFESKGEKITNYLNEEYLKLAAVFFISSFIMIVLVLFSSRRYHKQQAKVESEKVVTTQRSHNFESISDEIRQPLNALMGALVTLEESDPEKQKNLYLDSAKKSAIQISELVNEINDFAKINNGEFKLELIEFDLRATVNDIADLMSVQASEKGLEISCLVNSDIPKRVKGDATRLRQVLINLISFSIKYTEHGEISLCLSVEEQAKSDSLIHIDVSDTGNTIDQQSMLEHFKMFTDLAYFEKENYASEGLGLALSKQLINLMEGNIVTKENATGGNTFRISLPMPTVDAVENVAPEDNLKDKRVLIACEIENNRQMLSHALSKWGMSGGTMENFDQVVSVLQEAEKADNQYHACLIDVSLSSLSEKAFELVRQIRQEFEDSALSVIILTVQGTPGDAKIAKEAGAQAFLTKPMTRNSMKEVMLRIFDNKLENPPEFITRHTLKESEQASLFRILVAEENEELLKHVVSLFDNSYYQIDLARDGSSLETAINHNVYDMVLLDVDLPKIDIFSYVKKFRQYERDLNKALNATEAKFTRLPIIAIVAEISTEMTENCEKYGLDNLVSKPVTREQIENITSFHLKSKEH